MNYGHCEMADGEEINPRDSGTDEPLPLISGLEPQRIYGGKTVGQNKISVHHRRLGIHCICTFAYVYNKKPIKKIMFLDKPKGKWIPLCNSGNLSFKCNSYS